MAKYVAKHRTRRNPRLLFLISMTATVVAFLAPVAQADPSLTVTKASTDVDGGALEPGDIIEYSITISNAAGAADPADDPVLVDDVPANTTYVADSATVDDGTTLVTTTNPFAGSGQTLADIIAGDQTIATYQVQVDSPLPNGTLITNSASVSAANDAAAPVSSNTTSDAVTSAPVLSVTKTSDDLNGAPLEPGDTIEYTVTIENTGTDTAADVTLDDDTPANTTYVSGSAMHGATPVADDPSGVDDNPFDNDYLVDATLTAGESHTLTFQVDVDTPLANNTAIVNTATASSTNAPSAQGTTSDPVTSMPGLTVTKTSSPAEGGPVTPGDTIEYTITIENDVLATETATGVELTDALPSNTTYVTDSATVDGTTVTGATNPFETGYALPDMAPGDSITATFSAVVDTPLDNATPITNTATVSSDQLPDASDEATVTVQSAPELTLVKTSTPAEGSRVTPGTTIAYSIVITNDPDATEVADDLELLDPTPSNTSYVQGSGTLNGAAVTATGNPFGTPFDLPDLDPGESHTITFSVRVNSPLFRGTVISNQARLTADNHANVQDTATHTVDSAPVLKLTLSASPPSGTKVGANDTIRYTIVVENDAAATESLRNVRVFAPTPNGTTFVEGSATLDGATINAPTGREVGAAVAAPGPFPGGVALGTMAPGTSHTLTYRVRVKASADTITNQVTVTADNAPTTVATLSHRGPNRGSGAGGDGDGGGGGGTGTGTGGGGTVTGGELAFTGLDLVRLLLLAITLLLAGWLLVARGRAVQRRLATGRVAEPVPSTGSVTVDRWVDAWFYSEKRR